MRWLALALLASVAHADVVTTPSIAMASASGVSLRVAPVLASTEHLMDVDGNTQPSCDRDLGCPPTLPFGSIWIDLRNEGTEPLLVKPDEFTLLARGKTYRALGTKAELEARWHDVLWHAAGLRAVDADSLEQVLHDRLPVLSEPITLAPGHAVRGYVVFDVAARQLFDYENFLRDSEQLFVVLKTPTARLAPTFTTRDR